MLFSDFKFSHCIRAVTLLGGILISAVAQSHGRAATVTNDVRAIEFPDTADYQTLTVDLHTHSVFSDGHVWPKIRVEEALRDQLDALAITEHLEYQPHRADILHPDRNRAYDIAADAAKNSDLIVIRGSEITRDAPAGHINAVFIDDANKLIKVDKPPADTSDVLAYYSAAKEWPAQKAVEAAHAQNAFIFWNHPYWTRQAPDGIARMNKFHSANARNGVLHGIEIANGSTYSEEAFQLALDYNLTLVGVSDVHDLIDWDYKPHDGGHRPVTLVFAKAKTAAAIKEALFARRTVVWFRNLLIGREQHLQPLLAASLSASPLSYRATTYIAEVTLNNVSDADFNLRYTGDYTFMNNADRITVPAHGQIKLQIKPGKRSKKLTLPFVVENTLTAPEKHAQIEIEVAE
ncbi:MAG: Sb-PDE family phosphodiesterase [Pseudomonadota bacterium]|nr:Sb-PDE family phosphodiesterase [Pseudomonadota bacterium]